MKKVIFCLVVQGFYPPPPPALLGKSSKKTPIDANGGMGGGDNPLSTSKIGVNLKPLKIQSKFKHKTTYFIAKLSHIWCIQK